MPVREVHSSVGENGAGKSTRRNVLTVAENIDIGREPMRAMARELQRSEDTFGV